MGLLLQSKSFLSKKFCFNQNFQTRSRLHINFYIRGHPFNMYTSVPISKQNEQIWLCWPKCAQKWIFSSKLRITILEIKTDNFDVWGPNLLKKEITIWNSESYCWNKNQHLWDTMCTNFQTNKQLWIFGPKFAQKWILGSK